MGSPGGLRASLIGIPRLGACLLDAVHQNLVRSAHQPDSDDQRMFMDGRKPQGGRKVPHGYAIRLRGPLGRTITSAFPDLKVTRWDEDTVLTGAVVDQAALYGLLRQLEELGVELVALHPLPSGSERWTWWPPPSSDGAPVGG